MNMNRLLSLALSLVALAACGDNQAGLALDSSFDDTTHTRYFGNLAGIGPAPARANTPLAHRPACVDDACADTDGAGTFVIVGPGMGHEGMFHPIDPDHYPTIVPVVGGYSSDRNIGTVIVLDPSLLTQSAAGFGIDPMLATQGTVLVLASRYGTGTIQLAIDGATTSYLDAMLLPDPTRAELSTSNAAVFFAVPPGEAILRTTAGRCDPSSDGWPTATGVLRMPIVAGELTIVHPLCTGAP